ncbi:hypothetical protein [Streptomyces paludis]|uniref:hypothetical protein n=1 Tax=Streptomyces paludis TaxID=2282738 RepID=UPI0013B45456|nr:hypothetical protein [Streptomyces paludis]
MMAMKFVMATSSDRFIQECRRMLGHIPGIEFRTGSIAETGWDCDAAILNSPLAHERYGGSPRIGSVQVLVNHRDDGAPGIILATAPIDFDSATASPLAEEIGMHVQKSLGACTSAFAREFSEEASILIHLEGAGIDRPDIKAPLAGVLKFLEEYQRS